MVWYFLAGFIAGFVACLQLGRYLHERMKKSDNNPDEYFHNRMDKSDNDRHLHNQVEDSNDDNL